MSWEITSSALLQYIGLQHHGRFMGGLTECSFININLALHHSPVVKFFCGNSSFLFYFFLVTSMFSLLLCSYLFLRPLLLHFYFFVASASSSSHMASHPLCDYNEAGSSGASISDHPIDPPIIRVFPLCVTSSSMTTGWMVGAFPQCFSQVMCAKSAMSVPGDC